MGDGDRHDDDECEDCHLLRHNAISKLHAVKSQELMVADGENNRNYETEGKDTEGYIRIWKVVCEKTENENEAWHKKTLLDDEQFIL